MNLVSGDNRDNVLYGSQFEDSIVGYGGIDEMHGRGGNDLFDIVQSETGPGEVIDGGNGEDTIYCSGMLDFRPAAVTSIEAIEFFLFESIVENLALFSWNGLADDLQITGSGGIDRLSLRVDGDRTLDAKNFVLWDWSEDDFLEFVGDAGKQVLHGSSFGEVFAGGAGNDTIWGNYGSDTADGGTGADDLAGEDGDDSIAGGSGNDSLSGGSGADTLIGGEGNDAIDGFDGLVLGGEGDDVITMGATTIDGGEGTDTLELDEHSAGELPFKNLLSIERIAFTGNQSFFRMSENGLDDVHFAKDLIIRGGPGNDFLTLELTRTVNLDISALRLESWSSHDRITVEANKAANTLTGSDGSDSFDGKEGNDRLVGNGGTDFLGGNFGNDTIDGADGDDYLSGDNGKDLVYGGAGNDHISDWTGVDTMLGNDGNDTIELNHAPVRGDIIDGGDGRDRIEVFSNLDIRPGQFKSIEYLLFRVDGWQLEQTLVLSGASFSDGGFAESLRIERTNNPYAAGLITVNMGSATEFDGSSFSFVNWIARPEGIVSSDVFKVQGGDTDDTITGTRINDTIVGGKGNDTITGGAGGDTLTGSGGQDVFVYLSTVDTANAQYKPDWITDLSAGDKIDLSAIDASRKLAGDQAFALDGDGSFSAGKIRQLQLGADVLLELNTDGDAQVEMSLLILDDSFIAGLSFIL